MDRKLRFALLGIALSLCTLASGCRLSGLHVVIPDFASSSVKGVRVMRIESTGLLRDAGRIVFGRIKRTTQGELIPCTHIAPNGATFGPVDAVVTRPANAPRGIDVRIPFSNPLSSGWFRVATYNAVAHSVPSDNRIWVN